MPIILVYVPESADDEALRNLRELVKDAISKEGVPRKHITVEFPKCACPEKLVIDYRSGSVHLHRAGQLDRDAKIVGQIVEDKLGFPVECLVGHFKRKNVGLYLTKV